MLPLLLMLMQQTLLQKVTATVAAAAVADIDAADAAAAIATAAATATVAAADTAAMFRRFQRNRYYTRSQATGTIVRQRKVPEGVQGDRSTGVWWACWRWRTCGWAECHTRGWEDG